MNGDLRKAELEGRLVTGVAHNDDAEFIGDNWLAKPKLADRGGHRVDSLVVHPRIVCVRPDFRDVAHFHFHGLSLQMLMFHSPTQFDLPGDRRLGGSRRRALQRRPLRLRVLARPPWFAAPALQRETQTKTGSILERRECSRSPGDRRPDRVGFVDWMGSVL